MSHDIRWIQRFSNYKKALGVLRDAVALHSQRELSRLEKQGLIQAFEFTHELAWKTIKDFLVSRGTVSIFGSKDATREAFKLELIEDGDVWMQMISSRNLSSHTYDETTANEIVKQIVGAYAPAFENMLKRFSALENDETAK